ncbi:hypothetical protein [Nitrosomonas sp. Nm34]|uniref:hypothetical protein n=1 Tax=Nitrosomonas sp. Nm34 TaxID=1881055 RepID=UPI0008DFFD44|nr:hypothetical protein [Nitrosomonas sp. Nm34]SFI90355.1 hypothetical protein SAMN05428978_105518 [Nitrosomonas sp. Nm34]
MKRAIGYIRVSTDILAAKGGMAITAAEVKKLGLPQDFALVTTQYKDLVAKQAAQVTVQAQDMDGKPVLVFPSE